MDLSVKSADQVLSDANIQLDNFLRITRVKCNFYLRLSGTGRSFLCFLLTIYGDSEILLFFLYLASTHMDRDVYQLLTKSDVIEYWKSYRGEFLLVLLLGA